MRGRRADQRGGGVRDAGIDRRLKCHERGFDPEDVGSLNYLRTWKAALVGGWGGGFVKKRRERA